MDKLNLKLNIDFGKLKPKNKFKSHSVANPHRHWVIMLNTFFAILILLICSSFVLLYLIKTDSLFQGGTVGPNANGSAARNEKMLTDIKTYFADKQAKIDKIKKDGLVLPDPSIMK